jgi:hypothetical protein
MSDDLRERLDALAVDLRSRFPEVSDVSASPYTDSTGDPAVRVWLTLRDRAGSLSFAQVAPLEAFVVERLADTGRYVYVRYRLESEQRELDAGTYFD